MSKTIKDILHDFSWMNDDELGEDRFEGHHDIDKALQAIATLIEEAVPEYNSKQSRSYFQPNTDPIKSHKNGYRLGVRDFAVNLSKIMEEQS